MNKNNGAAKNISLILLYLIKWTALCLPVSIAIGSFVAFFLWLLDKAMEWRVHHPWLLFMLPLAGVFIYFIYKWAGKNAVAGNHLILEEIHSPGKGVPFRMAPLVLSTTIITHLFGGSAGREGTAVQIGGSTSHLIARLLRLPEKDVPILLMVGIAAGFGAVFGTPVTGALFALEVLAVRQIKYPALFPCAIASIMADSTCRAWGIQHTSFKIAFPAIADVRNIFFQVDLVTLAKTVVAGVLFGITAYLFSHTTRAIKEYSSKWIGIKWMVPFAGGIAIIMFTYLLGTTDYLSLGVYSEDPGAVTILSSF
ncbi:MAG: chloride channel protein, partial [Chitinophagaceae bacterium]|nr:chloride channel protein [Chitinophagaceae bacterium]